MNPNFARLCRCCATEHNLMYDIFCGTCTNAQTYHDVIMECARVQLFRNDGLPSLVCHSCVSALESFVVFRRKCIESESILKQMRINTSPDERQVSDFNRIGRDYPALCDIKEELSDKDSTVESEPEENLLIEKCPEFEIKIKESLDSNRVKRDGSMPETLNDIKTEFDDIEESSGIEIRPEMMYVGIKTEDTAVDENRPGTSSPADRPCVEIDRRSMENVCDVKEEFVEPEKSCLGTDRTDEGALVHTCVRCGESFLDRHCRLRADREWCTSEKPYPCEKSFSNIEYLDEHRDTRTGETQHARGESERAFHYKSHVVHHRKRRTGERSSVKPYSCGESGLKSHRYTGERPYSCDDCEDYLKFLRSVTFIKKSR